MHASLLSGLRVILSSCCSILAVLAALFGCGIAVHLHSSVGHICAWRATGDLLPSCSAALARPTFSSLSKLCPSYYDGCRPRPPPTPFWFVTVVPPAAACRVFWCICFPHASTARLLRSFPLSPLHLPRSWSTGLTTVTPGLTPFPTSTSTFTSFPLALTPFGVGGLLPPPDRFTRPLVVMFRSGTCSLPLSAMDRPPASLLLLTLTRLQHWTFARPGPPFLLRLCPRCCHRSHMTTSVRHRCFLLSHLVDVPVMVHFRFQACFPFSGLVSHNFSTHCVQVLACMVGSVPARPFACSYGR